MENTIKKSSFINFIVLIAIILRCTSTALVDISYVFLIFLCFLGPRSIIISIFLLWLFYSLNTPLFPINSGAYSFTRFLIIFLALILSFHKLPKKSIYQNIKIYSSLILFILFVVIQSSFKSPFVEVSILKIATWSSLFILLMNCWSKIDKEEFYLLSKNIFSFFALITISSLFLVKNEFGYIQNAELFQGILHHPQLFAIVMSVFGLMIITGFPYRFSSQFVNLLLLAIVIYLLILSNGRTGILALFLSTFIYVLVNPTFDHIKRQYTNTSKFIFFLSLVVLPFFIIMVFHLNNSLNLDFLKNIITKSGATDEKLLIGAYLESRGDLLFQIYNNIVDNFWSGIGFGIGSDLDKFVVLRDPFFNLPYFGAVEKGMIFLAVLEETGIFGFLFFILFLFSCFFNLCEAGFKSLPLFSLILLLNLGENSFFSTGGVGGLLLVFFTLSISKKVINNN